jgi:oligopeptide transport system substrate-binding protein
MGLVVSSLLGLGLVLGLIGFLGSQPVARAQVIASAASEGLEPEMGVAFDAPASTAAVPSEPHIRLEKNEDYFDAASVVITQATSLFIDPTEAWARYQVGELDTIAPPGSALETIKASPVYSPQLQAYPQTCTYYYGFSHDVAPFDDPRVRAAFAAAIDRPRLISEVESLAGDEFPALTFAPKGIFGHVDGYAAGIGRPYSPTQAQNLLASSGYTGTPTITLMFNASPGHQAIAEAVQQMWDDTLGISVTLESRADFGQYLDLLQNGSAAERPGVWRMGWCADYPDAYNFLSLFAGDDPGYARYDSPAYDALVQASASETNPSQRLELYEQAEATLVMTDTAIAPLYHYAQHRLTRPDLIRTYQPMGGQHLDDWDLSGDVRPLELAWGSPSSLDPALASNDYVEQLFLGLTDFDENGNVMPGLATSWDVSDDATVYTFTMRSDAVWTDGSPVTAQDVEYGVLRSLDPDTGAGAAYVLYVIENAQAYREGSISDPDLVGVEALDATHVRFTLAEPASYFPIIAGMPPARPQPESAIETYGCGWTAPENIVTNGPYELVSWEGPSYLGISKSARGNPLVGGTFDFEIAYQNAGASAAAGVVITDTMDGFAYISDTASFSHTGSGTPGDPLVWDLGSVPAHSCGSFDVRVQVTESAGSEVSNRAEIATSDPDDQAQPWEKVSEWWGNVGDPTMMVQYGEDRASGVYAVGHTFWITVTDDLGGVKATATAETVLQGSGPDGAWDQGFLVEGDDWSVPSLDIQPTDQVHFRSDDGYTNTVQVGTITGEADPAADTISGTITVPWYAGLNFSGQAGAWGFTFKSFNLALDPSTGADDYFVDFSPYDLLPGGDLTVSYSDPDGWVGNTIRVPGGLIYLPLVTKNQ